MNITLPGERWTDPHVDWRPRPYGSMSYALDHLPGELDDFFAVFNHHPPSFDSARVYVGENRFLYHRPGGFGRQKWDFLNGLVTATDCDQAAIVARIDEQTRIGLDALFFGGSISHSHFTQHLQQGAWKGILDAAEKRLSDLEYIPASYDAIAAYARARAGTQLTAARRSGSGGVELELEGSSPVPLRISVYDEADRALVRREHELPPFEGATTAVVSAVAA
jgi:hypothetical protein